MNEFPIPSERAEILRDFVIRVPETELVQDLRECVETVISAYEIDSVSYLHFDNPATTDYKDRARLVWSVNGPRHWNERYVAESLHVMDPIFEMATIEMRPIRWRDLDPGVGNSLAERAFLSARQKAQLGDGVSIVSFGPQLRSGLFNFGFGDVHEELEPETEAALTAVAQLAHLTYCRLVPDGVSHVARMTPREKQILGLMARGKSNGAIASILSLSPHTIDSRIRGIFDKLDVTDRTTAAIKGVATGAAVT